MGKKALVCVALASVLISSISLQEVKASGFNNEPFKELIEQRSDKPIAKGLVDPSAIKKFEANLQREKSLNKNAIRRMAASTDYSLEKESNDNFATANKFSYSKPMAGQLLPMYDMDFYKITVPSDGILLVGGTTNSYAIDLLFGAVEKDFKESKKLEYLGYEYEDDVLIQGYQAKAGTYYVPVMDYDNDYGLDDNTESDIYLIAADFIDNVKPGKPTVNKVDNNDKTVTGKAEANSTITIKSGSKKIATAKTSAKGTFSAKIAVQKAGTKLSVTATDSAKNVSSSVSVTVADVVAPSKPTINKVDDNDTKVTGKAEAGSLVVVKAGSKTLGSATADSKGVYSVKIKAQKKGTTLTVTAKDKAGNTSAKKTYVVVKH